MTIGDGIAVVGGAVGLVGAVWVMAWHDVRCLAIRAQAGAPGKANR